MSNYDFSDLGGVPEAPPQQTKQSPAYDFSDLGGVPENPPHLLQPHIVERSQTPSQPSTLSAEIHQDVPAQLMSGITGIPGRALSGIGNLLGQGATTLANTIGHPLQSIQELPSTLGMGLYQAPANLINGLTNSHIFPQDINELQSTLNQMNQGMPTSPAAIQNQQQAFQTLRAGQEHIPLANTAAQTVPYLPAFGANLLRNMLAGGAIGAANPGSLSDRISNAGAGATMAAAIPKTPDVLAAGGKFVDQAVTPVKNAVGEYVTNIPSEVWSDITQPNSQVWDLIKDSYMQDKAGGGTTPLPVQDFENRIIKGIRGDVDTQYHNLGAQVADAKNKMFNDFETAKSQEMYEAMHRAQNKAQTIEGINTGNLDTAVADSSARLDTLKNKYFQIKHDITPDNPKAAYLHEQLIQTQRDLTSEIRNNLNIKKRNLEKQNYDAESIDNAMRDELDRLAQKYTIHPDLRSAISKLKSVTNDRQFSGAPLAGSIKSILRELKEGVAPYRAQKLMDMLDYEVINYDKSMSELPYWSRELQSASKDARTNIDKTLTSLDPEYKAAKTKFHDFKILQEDEALNGILQPSKANPTSGAIKKLYSLNDKGNGLTKDALSRISSNPNQLFSDIRTANTAWNGYDAMKEAYAIPLSHSLIYNLIKGLPAPIRSVAFKPDSAVPMIENYQRLNALKQRLGRTTPIPQINPARLAPLSATASKRKKNI